MPTKEQMETVFEGIEKLRSARYGHLDEEGMLRTDMGNLVIPGDEGIPWEGLSSGAQGEALAYMVDWEGFTETQQDGLINRVIDGADAGSWLKGIEPDAEHDMDLEP